MSRQHTRSISWFTVIGIIAAAVHYVIAVGLEWSQIVSPAYANILGFLFAFPVSYFGHRAFSFSHQTSTHLHALPRFLSVALLGFLANQTLVVSALKFSILPFWLILGCVMLLIAVCTYLLSHYWAFKTRI